MDPVMPELFTIKEVATILKTNVEYVHKLRRAGLIPCLKLGCYTAEKQKE